MAVNTQQITILVVLFLMFLAIPTLVKSLGQTLDTLPVRFAAVILILGVYSYDPLVALAVFLVIAGLYIQRHHDVVISVTSNSSGTRFPVDAIQDPAAMKVLHQGGHASESYDTDNFMPKDNVENNEFEPVGYSSIDEKHALPTEQLGSRAQAMFGEEMRNAEALQQGNHNGSA
jgi:hypothetical protein